MAGRQIQGQASRRWRTGSDPTATTNRIVRTLALLSPAAMAVAVVITANHFVVDVAGGLVVVCLGLGAAELLAQSRRYPQASALSGGARRR